MIIDDYEDDNSENKTIDTTYSNLLPIISDLQDSVTVLNNEVNTLTNNESSFQTQLTNQLSSNTSELTRLVNTLIDNLSDSIANQVVTDGVTTNSLTSTTSSINNLHVDNGDIDVLTSDSITSTDVTSTNITTDSINSTNINSTNGVINELTSVRATIDELTTTIFNMNQINADEGNISTLQSIVSTIDRLNSHLITVSNSDPWKEPIGTPDNLHLLKITFPTYMGQIHVVTINKLLSLVISNSDLVTYTQLDDYIYRIEKDIDTNSINVYLTIAPSYKEIFIGSELYTTSSSELVSINDVNRNIDMESRSGTWTLDLEDMRVELDLLTGINILVCQDGTPIVTSHGAYIEVKNE